MKRDASPGSMHDAGNKEKIKKKKPQRARKQGRQKRLVSELEELYSNMLIS